MPTASNKPAAAGAPLRAAAVGYVRRSTDRQEQSIPDQQRAIRRYAEEQGFALRRFYTDDAISGTSTIGRRAFLRLIADAGSAARDFDVVIVYDVKRFGRIDNDEAGYYRHLLRTNGVEVLYASENFTGDTTDDLLRPVKQWQARQESKDLSKVTIRGLVSKAASGGGWWMGGAPPFGYDLRYESQEGQFILTVRYQRDGTKQILDEQGHPIRTIAKGDTVSVSKKDRCKLIPSDQQRADTIRLIFDLYAKERRGFKAIADHLNRNAIPTPRSKEWASRYTGKWSVTSVRAILTNPAYAGDLVWNRRTDARFHRIAASGAAIERPGVQGRRLEDNDESQWVVVRDAHPALIDRRTWETARLIREGKPHSEQQRGTNPRTGQPAGAPESGGPRARFLLSRLITCSRCGSTYEGRIDRRGNSSSTEKCYSYVCGGYIRHGRRVCTRGAIKQDILERLVIDAVLGHYAPLKGKKGKEKIRALIEEQIGAEARELEREQQGLQQRLDEIQRITRNLIDNLTETNRAAVDKRLLELEAERQEVERAVESIAHRAMSKRAIDQLVDETGAFVNGLESTLNGTDHEQRQAAIRRCVAGIEIDRDTCHAAIDLRPLPGGMRDGEAADVVRRSERITITA